MTFGPRGMGRLTQETRPSGQSEYYAYDQLGQRIKHWNSYYGGGNVERTDYDAQGRVGRSGMKTEVISAK